MNIKLATSRMRTGQWADVIKDCKKSGLKVDEYYAQHASPEMPSFTNFKK